MNGTPPPVDRRHALFLDVDGTVLDVAQHPLRVRVDRSIRVLLDRLQAFTGGAFALVSGRSLGALDALFAPARFAAAGQHGAEWRSRPELAPRLEGGVPPTRAAVAALERFAAAYPELLLEDKGINLALHYRLAPRLATVAAQEIDRAAALLGEHFEVIEGHFVLEIKPRGIDKGTAIARFMAEAPFAGRVPVFVGDDVTDERGFAVVERMGGMAIKVGDGDSVARWRLGSAAAVRRWLAESLARARN